MKIIWVRLISRPRIMVRLDNLQEFRRRPWKARYPVMLIFKWAASSHKHQGYFLNKARILPKPNIKDCFKSSNHSTSTSQPILKNSQVCLPLHLPFTLSPDHWLEKTGRIVTATPIHSLGMLKNYMKVNMNFQMKAKTNQKTMSNHMRPILKTKMNI